MHGLWLASARDASCQAAGRGGRKGPSRNGSEDGEPVAEAALFDIAKPFTAESGAGNAKADVS